MPPQAQEPHARPRDVGQSSLKTWVFGILRHHLLDHMRLASRHVSLESLAAEDGDWEWRLQSAYVDPEQGLPENARRVVMLREVLGHETEEIYDRLSLTQTNCHVILHRAKTRLRGLLRDQWGTAYEAIH